MHGDSRDVVAAAFDFACVQSTAEAEAEVARIVDDALCAPHALGRPGEGCEHAVTGRLDRLSAMGGDRCASVGQVPLERAGPFAIPGVGGAPGRVDEVGEQDGGQVRLVTGAGAVPVTNSSTTSAKRSTSSA